MARGTTRALARNRIAMRGIEVGQGHLAGERRFDRSNLQRHLRIHLGIGCFVDGFATRDTGFQHVNIIERGPNGLWCRFDALGAIHIHGRVSPGRLNDC